METCLPEHPSFCLAGIYGEPRRCLRSKTWELIQHLAGASDLLWCLFRDFNNILSQANIRGGNQYPNWLVHGFHEVVSNCNLFDMELIGHPFTWEMGRGTRGWLEIRLDQALTSLSWQNLFPNARLFNLDTSVSDHSPLFLDLTFQTRFRFKHRFSVLAYMD